MCRSVCVCVREKRMMYQLPYQTSFHWCSQEWNQGSLWRFFINVSLAQLQSGNLCQLLVWRPPLALPFLYWTFFCVLLLPWVYLFFEVGSVLHNRNIKINDRNITGQCSTVGGIYMRQCRHEIEQADSWECKRSFHE